MRSFLFLLSIFISLIASSQEIIQEGARSTRIMTPSAFPKGNPVGYPIVELSSRQMLEFRFDLAGLDRDDLQFAVIHCDHEWRPSDLSSNQYLQGFNQLRITEMEASFGTRADFVHYHFFFPNDMMQPVISGNYAVIVFEGIDAEDTDSWLMVWRTVFFEPQIRMKARVQQSSVVKNRFTHHEVVCEAVADNYRIINPMNELNMTILPNGDWSGGIHNLKPAYVRPDAMVFEYSDGRSELPAGNEWRDFEMKDMRFAGLGVQSISAGSDAWHVMLRPDFPRGGRGAFDSRNDLNGRFLIRSDIASDSHLEAEYVKVHFTLQLPEVNEGRVLIEGGLSRYAAQPWEMTYDRARNAYVYEAMVKQGYYNYRYAIYDMYHPTGDVSLTEGNFSATENDYHVIIYHYDRRLGADRAVGFHALRSNR